MTMPSGAGAIAHRTPGSGASRRSKPSAAPEDCAPASAASGEGEAVPVLARLEGLCRQRGLEALAVRIGELAELVQWDMAAVEAALTSLPRSERIVHRSASHLLDQGGKRLRPLCVALASRVGSGEPLEQALTSSPTQPRATVSKATPDEAAADDDKEPSPVGRPSVAAPCASPHSGPQAAARELGVAVELVHCATLLHDDVVDDSDQRRGAPAARTLYGNAASIFAGDWLLVHALQRVRKTHVPGALERLLDIIDAMITAESLQLESRGNLELSARRYFDIIDGKTAALFRWAMYAGARAGGLTDPEARQLEEYGQHLGLAFQLVDDLLDYAGDAETTGKSLFADLREGKATYPLILAMERDPSLEVQVAPLLAASSGLSDDERTTAFARLRQSIAGTGAIDDARALAAEQANLAVAALDGFADGPTLRALKTVALATVYRER